MFNRNRLLLLMLWCVALVHVACGQASVQTVSESGSGRPESGPTSLEERLLLSDVVARVRLISADGRALDGTNSYTAVLEFRFRVLEYLKGSGGAEVVAVTIDEDRYDTASAARAAVPGMVAARDTRWDGREAIVFMLDYHAQNGRTTYLLGGLPSTGKMDTRWRAGTSKLGCRKRQRLLGPGRVRRTPGRSGSCWLRHRTWAHRAHRPGPWRLPRRPGARRR